MAHPLGAPVGVPLIRLDGIISMRPPEPAGLTAMRDMAKMFAPRPVVIGPGEGGDAGGDPLGGKPELGPLVPPAAAVPFPPRPLWAHAGGFENGIFTSAQGFESQSTTGKEASAIPKNGLNLKSRHSDNVTDDFFSLGAQDASYRQGNMFRRPRFLTSQIPQGEMRVVPDAVSYIGIRRAEILLRQSSLTGGGQMVIQASVKPLEGPLVYFDDRPVPPNPPKKRGEIETPPFDNRPPVEPGTRKKTFGGTTISIEGARPPELQQDGSYTQPIPPVITFSIDCEGGEWMALDAVSVFAEPCPQLVEKDPDTWAVPESPAEEAERKADGQPRSGVGRVIDSDADLSLGAVGPKPKSIRREGGKLVLEFQPGGNNMAQYEGRGFSFVQVLHCFLFWWCCRQSVHGPFLVTTKEGEHYDCVTGKMIQPTGPYTYGPEDFRGEFNVQMPNLSDVADREWARTKWGSQAKWCENVR